MSAKKWLIEYDRYRRKRGWKPRKNIPDEHREILRNERYRERWWQEIQLKKHWPSLRTKRSRRKEEDDDAESEDEWKRIEQTRFGRQFKDSVRQERTDGHPKKYPESFERKYWEIQRRINNVYQEHHCDTETLNNTELNKLVKWSQQVKKETGIYTRRMREILETWMERQQRKKEKITLLVKAGELGPEQTIIAGPCDTIRYVKSQIPILEGFNLMFRNKALDNDDILGLIEGMERPIEKRMSIELQHCRRQTKLLRPVEDKNGRKNG